MAKNSVDLDDFVKNAPKWENVLNSIIRKGLLVNNKLSVESLEYLAFLDSPEQEKLIISKPKDDLFIKWWQEYPGLDSFTYKGRSFKGSRALRVKKEDCRIKIKAILNEGEYTIDDLIGALKLEIQQKMENSLKTNQNKMSYMQNSLTYLNQRTWEPFIELYRQGNKQEQTLSGGIDI